jgi:hypothetical protein
MVLFTKRLTANVGTVLFAIGVDISVTQLYFVRVNPQDNGDLAYVDREMKTLDRSTMLLLWRVLVVDCGALPS